MAIRAASLSGVQTRYPFLDVALFDFLAPLAARWKIRGLTDKYLERQLAHKWLPDEVTAGRKSLLHAPLEALHLRGGQRGPNNCYPTIHCGRHPISMRRQYGTRMATFPKMRHGFRRLFIEMGVVGVLTTQLWHHLYIDPNLCELPSY